METKVKKRFVKPEMIKRVREGDGNEAAAAEARPIKPQGMPRHQR